MNEEDSILPFRIKYDVNIDKENELINIGEQIGPSFSMLAVDLKEQAIRDGLIKLGWSPPHAPYKEAFDAAKAFIDANVCDYDITNEMTKAYAKYILVLKKLKEVLK